MSSTAKKSKIEIDDQANHDSLSSERKTRFGNGKPIYISLDILSLSGRDNTRTSIEVKDDLTIDELKKYISQEILHHPNIKFSLETYALANNKKWDSSSKLRELLLINKFGMLSFRVQKMYGDEALLIRYLKAQKTGKSFLQFGWASDSHLIFNHLHNTKVVNYDTDKNVYTTVFTKANGWNCNQVFDIGPNNWILERDKLVQLTQPDVQKLSLKTIDKKNCQDLQRAKLFALYGETTLRLVTWTWARTVLQYEFPKFEKKWECSLPQAHLTQNGYPIGIVCSEQQDAIAVAVQECIFFLRASTGEFLSVVSYHNSQIDSIGCFQDWGIVVQCGNRIQVFKWNTFTNQGIEQDPVFEWIPFPELEASDLSRISMNTDPHFAPDLICVSVSQLSRIFTFDGRCCQSIDHFHLIRVNQRRNCVICTNKSTTGVYSLIDTHRRENLILLLLAHRYAQKSFFFQDFFPIDLLKFICSLAFLYFPKFSLSK